MTACPEKWGYGTPVQKVGVLVPLVPYAYALYNEARCLSVHLSQSSRGTRKSYPLRQIRHGYNIRRMRFIGHYKRANFAGHSENNARDRVSMLSFPTGKEGRKFNSLYA